MDEKKTLLTSGLRCFYRCDPNKNKACAGSTNCYRNGGRCYLTSVKDYAKRAVPERIFKEGQWQ